MSQRLRLRERLEAADLVHLDGRILAFHLLGSPEYGELTHVLFDGLRSGSCRSQTSALALYQLLAEVYRRGEAELADEVAKLLTVHPALELVPAGPDVAVQAAQVRAQLGGRPERAIQIATALVAGAEIFLTEGSGLRRIVGMSVVNLEDYL
ncbi:MAG: type II toxin-antitoxin system VapC family toxin [Gemmatimonadota bacterium]